MSLTVCMRSSSGGSLSTGVVWDRHTCMFFNHRFYTVFPEATATHFQDVHVLKWKSHHFDEIFITGCTYSWQNVNFLLYVTRNYLVFMFIVIVAFIAAHVTIFDISLSFDFYFGKSAISVLPGKKKCDGEMFPMCVLYAVDGANIPWGKLNTVTGQACLNFIDIW